ncbi:MAG: tetratricopeptide repeat protein [Desulfobacula sp.]|nr:tetratricopeptide repeat protein [Desulfobacula sp.]
MTTGQKTERKLSAILSADVKGYSRLMSDDEGHTIKTLKEYRNIMSEIITSHSGRLVDAPGDNLLAEFSSAVNAVQGSVEIQKTLKARNDELPDDRKLVFRIGINIGDIVQDGSSLYGEGINIAARIESLADPGGVCISRNAYDHIKNKLKLGYEYIGEHSVKNIKDPVRVYKILMDDEDAGKMIGENKKSFLKPLAWSTVIIASIIFIAYLFVQKPAVPEFEPASIDNMAHPLPDKPSIAVLPFDNMSNDKEQDYFSDGITEDIITALSKTSKMLVISRNSTFTYKGKAVKIRQVAEELGVRYVLEGSFRKDGDRIRITAQLIDALSGHHMWADRYDRDLKDVFALQDEITMKILTALQMELTDGEYALISAKGTDNLQAYLKVLQAREFFYTMTKDGLLMARRLCEHALSMDPKYAAAYLYLGSTHFMETRIGSSKSPQDSLKLAFEYVTKAKALDETYASASSILAFLYVMRRQYDQAVAESERAIALEPSSGAAHMWMSYVHTFAGNHEEAVRQAEYAIRLDPFPIYWWYRGLGSAYFSAGRYEEAVAACQKALRSAPDDIVTHLTLTTAYSWAGHLKEAQDQAKEVLRINPKFSLKEQAKKSLYRVQEDGNRFIEGLRMAGLPETNEEDR